MNRTIAIVGNGEVAEGSARVIDAADIVIRFNDCRSAGRGGTKTDIVAVCNTGRPGLRMSQGHEWANIPCVLSASEIWCTRDGARFSAMRESLLRTHPELDDFCDDHTAGFQQICATYNKKFGQIEASIHDELDRQLADFMPGPYVVPSTGLLTIAHVLEKVAVEGDRIIVSGFGHQGWELHPWCAEKLWLEQKIRQGRLIRMKGGETPVLTPAVPCFRPANAHALHPPIPH